MHGKVDIDTDDLIASCSPEELNTLETQPGAIAFTLCAYTSCSKLQTTLPMFSDGEPSIEKKKGPRNYKSWADC